MNECVLPLLQLPNLPADTTLVSRRPLTEACMETPERNSLKDETMDNDHIHMALLEEESHEEPMPVLTSMVIEEAQHIEVSNDGNLLAHLDIENDNSGSKKKGRPCGPKKTQNNKGRENKSTAIAPFEKEGALTKEDVKCPICVSIFIEPVSFPCKHTLCLECYNNSVEKASLHCPICRFRLSVWSRTAVKQNKLINTQFWEKIQAQFPSEVEARLDGKDSQEFPGYEPSPNKPLVRDGCIAQEGEIRHEFDIILKKHAEDLENEKRKEAEASSELIRQLQEEEGPLPPVQSPTQLERDFELAKKLQEEEQLERQREKARALALSRFNQTLPNPNGPRPSVHPGPNKRCSTPASVASKSKRASASVTDLLQSKQKKISSFFEIAPAVRPPRSDTPDSINAEFNHHFQPIAPAPKTPPKKNADGSLEASLFVASKPKPVRRDLSLEFSQLDQNQNQKDSPPSEYPDPGKDVLLGRSLSLISGIGPDHSLRFIPSDASMSGELSRSRVDESLNDQSQHATPETRRDVNSAEQGASVLSFTFQAATNNVLALAPFAFQDQDKTTAFRNPKAPISIEFPGTTVTVREDPKEKLEYEEDRIKIGLDSSRVTEAAPVVAEPEDDLISLPSAISESADEAETNGNSGIRRQALSPLPDELEDEDVDENSEEKLWFDDHEERLENERALARIAQEEEDRKFALKLQRELNKPFVERDKYELRKTVKVSAAPGISTSAGPSTSQSRPSAKARKNPPRPRNPPKKQLFPSDDEPKQNGASKRVREVSNTSSISDEQERKPGISTRAASRRISATKNEDESPTKRTRKRPRRFLTDSSSGSSTEVAVGTPRKK